MTTDPHSLDYLIDELFYEILDLKQRGRPAEQLNRRRRILGWMIAERARRERAAA